MTGPDSVPRTISFQCPHCGHRTEVESRFAGQTGPCVGCSKPITIPTLESLVAQPESRKVPTTPKSWVVKTAIGIGVVTAISLLVFVAVLVGRPMMNAAREAAMRSECESNLLLIGLALEEYHDKNGHYPVAVVRDKDGKAMHSWRVLLLPYLGPDAALLYKEYNMSEPWNSPQNSLLSLQMPEVYRCPADTNLVGDETSYLAVVGEKTLINTVEHTTRTGSGLFALQDRPGETMVLLESKSSGVNWMNPVDIPFATLRAELNSSNIGAPGSEHPRGVHVLMADRSVVRLPDHTTASDLRGMATINGGDEFVEILDEILYE